MAKKTISALRIRERETKRRANRQKTAERIKQKDWLALYGGVIQQSLNAYIMNKVDVFEHSI